ncbi:hypothetical protein PSN45_002894 [Yamadazyma tenuis]|uniref:Uncharacterized protein n=1 Tax=Candida tenuis (strain ATCC 10573 / BCRC 21748 / CBS 615 / JCM 9827 / NBRC 10315 / NRRL Y-1498 / VKM Y-70) TaxID=590646 RepID=G3AWC5_CANTC|nr:uncharacterized protein CANTEDRAFT_112228 [Yamadazyma tenuis ATCC 10573]XP_006684045.1 uncharacterized protein CANTEDRAFT_112228 [Yamadazyma tenuis ATCC 10573]EGV66786.1 hypothetical protein CANTEDRAFT_112228 [Yamadazyma tenuis ATCC 10573]EGV66787.1 hypothetical protein CANTEDRAFT_112228 [Yamadazyma tenuis ATCC 10573]WEJ95377.1 hypothetical protein PSN45_002894 [Yamadazyma tenuis]
MASPNIFEYTIPELLDLETDEALQFSQFDNEIAWKLGCFARRLSLEKFPSSAVVIDIALVNNQILFHATTKSGTTLDNDQWVERKKRTVQRLGTSSFVVGQHLRQKKTSMEDALFISSRDYASHGGCVPIKVKGFDGLVGTLTISGLPQDQDHLLALETLREFNKGD